MYRIIGGDGREYGPVSAAQITQWLAQNRANGDTRIKPEGAADWTTLAALPEFAAAFASPVSPPPLPGEGAVPPPATTTAPAEAAASPVGGFAATPATAPLEAARACLDRPFRLSVMDTLSRGWDILASRFWLVAGATTVALLTSMVAGMLPIVGIAASILLTQVFYAGIYWLMLRVSRGESAEFADVFGGFSRSFAQLMLLSLTVFCCTLVLAVLAMGPLLWALYRAGVFAGAEPDPTQMVGPLLVLPVLMLPLLYLSIGWLFAPLLVIDRGMGFWEAMETSRRMINKRWFRMFFLYLAFIPLMIAGLLCFIVGDRSARLTSRRPPAALGIPAFPSSPPRYNAAPRQALPIVRRETGSRRREAALLRWGLVPAWSPTSAAASPLINARAESAAEKPAFRDAFRHRRCAVPADGFYEWQRTPAGPMPWLFEHAAGDLLLFAGLWESHVDPEADPAGSFAVLTTAPNTLVAPLHDRMPALLPVAALHEWLDAATPPARLMQLLVPCTADRLRARPVNPRLNHVAHDDPSCLDAPPDQQLDLGLG